MANLRLSENNSSSLDNCRARANYQNLILASKREVKSGSQMWHVYHLSENTKRDEFFFAQPIKALRYAFLLRKRSGAILPKAIYTKLMADVSASKAQAEPSAAQESAPQAEQAAEPSALAKAFEQMKAKHPNTLLLFRMGDFYGSFADDAKTLSEVFAGFKQWIEAEFNQRYSFKHLQGYLDEYNFRVSHRRNPQRNFDILIRAMMDNEETNEENG